MIENDLENMKIMLNNDNPMPISTLQYVLLPKCKDEIFTRKNNQNYIKSYLSQGVNPKNIVPTNLEDGIWVGLPNQTQNQFTKSILKDAQKYTEQLNYTINRYSEYTQMNSIIKSCNTSRKGTKRVTFENSETLPEKYYQPKQ
ncbi:unnamed protein product (macronuclear) [Paramecium tetraurelia]|uniref:Uncharacterized protein n=1 Tax=Paramecium tetraurelia TaxID=5888 RepID=A0DPN7_PARTE|nr:uncharacterized protein GSPATT00019186001 [Paramecium tetraurelia]CAK85004.1 unnamed protein product [Paramecium tetraurelia]|eukprot:XP_001452401.1 hypothetical protein (macronuclear) [Paramecium tetraurelia strain d4-2]